MSSQQDDPRFLRSRGLIVEAARALLMTSGPQAVTHGQVAAEAGIARATVYRHWPRTDQLLLEAMASVPLPFFEVDEAPTLEWFVQELTALARQLGQHDVRVVATTLANAALWDAELNDRRSQFARTLSDRITSALEGAEERGDVRLRVAAGDAAAMMIGPLYYRATIERADTTPDVIRGIVEAVGSWA